MEHKTFIILTEIIVSIVILIWVILAYVDLKVRT